MIQDCKFNPWRDLEKVSPDGALDLCKAYALGSIPSSLEGSEADYNNIDDPASISGKPSDVFDSMAMEKTIQERGKSKSSE